MKLHELLRKCLNTSYTYQHIERVYNTLMATTTEPNHSSNRNRVYNVVFDVLLGVAFYIVFVNQLDLEVVSSLFILLAEKTKDSLKQLIKWLMGAPAGLKLNKELSYFLGNFFSYHVDIWMTYLLIVFKFLPQISTIMAWCCCLGLSLLLSLLNDIINVLTVHIYCFYAYAAKLYHIQLKGLVSLARLFRGKKWNVLRLRVDSITYQADQLILGTILFTILLFLLPTTLLYYTVFTTTRLTILLTQILISTMIDLLMGFPFYDLCRRVHHSDHMATDELDITYTIPSKTSRFQKDAATAHHHIVRTTESIKYAVKKKKIPFIDIIKMAYSFQSPDLKDLFWKILTGVLIQPWNG